MAGNFIPMVYAVLKDKGVETKDMTADEAVEKYNEIIGKTGRYNVEKGEREDKEKNTNKKDEKVLTNSNSTGKLPSSVKVNGFKKNDLNEHFDRHKAEFNFNNVAEYNKLAIDFITSSRGELYSVNINGKTRYYRFDPETMEFASIGKDGNLITYFLVKGGNKHAARKYVDNNMKKKGAKKL